MGRIPAYMRVYDILKRQILEKEYQVGQFLSPEPILEKKFNVSRTTIRKAIEMLSREGFVSVKQGKGTEILDYRTMQNLNYVSSISETLQEKGYKVSTKDIVIDFIEADASLASEFNINQGDKIVRIQRIKLADSKEIAIMKNYLLPSMVEGIENCDKSFISLYKFLEENYNIYIDATRDKISAKSANSKEAKMLEVSEGYALLTIKRTCYEASKPVCIDDICIIGDRYEFNVNMSGRN
jgi:GntR family transcriptional regulator